MNEQTITAIQKALAPVAEKIGQGAQYGWDVVVRQQYIEGIANLIQSGFELIAIFVLLRVLKICYQKGRADDWDNPGWFFGTMFGVIGIVVLSISVPVDLISGVRHLLNPAYYALDFFIHLGTPTS